MIFVSLINLVFILSELSFGIGVWDWVIYIYNLLSAYLIILYIQIFGIYFFPFLIKIPDFGLINSLTV